MAKGVFSARTASILGYFAFFSVFTALSIVFGINVIDIPGVSYPLTITFGVLSGLFGLGFVCEGLKSSQSKGGGGGGGACCASVPNNGGEANKSFMRRDQLFAKNCTIVLVGDSRVGKTELLGRLSGGVFLGTYEPTVAADFRRHPMTIGESNVVSLVCWDTSAREEFAQIVKSYYGSADAILLVFDVTNRTSFDNIHKHYAQVKKYSKEGVPIILVGNKSDASSEERQVTAEEAQTLVSELGLHYYQETSAKTNRNVIECFTQAAQAVFNRLTQPSQANSSVSARSF